MLLPRLARRVAGGDVADLVPQDGGELVFVIQMGEHPARDIDVPSGKGHGVDDRTVEYTESNRTFAKLLLGSRPPEVTCRENAVADHHDVALQFRITVKTEKSGDLLTGLLADLGFLLPAIAEIPFLSGGGNDIGRAAEKEKDAQEKG